MQSRSGVEKAHCSARDYALSLRMAAAGLPAFIWWSVLQRAGERVATHTVSVLFFFFFFFFSLLFRAAPEAYGSSQPHQIWATSATYTTAHGNAGSLTHWGRPGSEPVSSWIVAGFLTHWATAGTPILLLCTCFYLTMLWGFRSSEFLFLLKWAPEAFFCKKHRDFRSSRPQSALEGICQVCPF